MIAYALERYFTRHGKRLGGRLRTSSTPAISHQLRRRAAMKLLKLIADRW
jgi:hypothetical protein